MIILEANIPWLRPFNWDANWGLPLQICHFLSLNRTCKFSLSFGKQVHYHTWYQPFYTFICLHRTSHKIKHETFDYNFHLCFTGKSWCQQSLESSESMPTWNKISWCPCFSYKEFRWCQSWREDKNHLWAPKQQILHRQKEVRYIFIVQMLCPRNSIPQVIIMKINLGSLFGNCFVITGHAQSILLIYLLISSRWNLQS